MGNIIFNLWVYFIIYSICGWIMESFFRSIAEKKLINTGFLNGPFCPIYGIGAIIMILLLGKFENSIVLLYITSFFILSIWEYVVGIYLEKVFKTKYWDYSDHKINIKGRVCLLNSLFWGFLGVVFIKFIHPFVEEKLLLVNSIGLTIVVLIITVIFIIDTLISIIKVKNIKTTLDKIEELNNQIKEKLEEIKALKNKKTSTDLIEGVENAIEKLNNRKNRILRNLYRRVYRLKKAFPTIDTNEIREILNKKKELTRKDKKKRVK